MVMLSYYQNLDVYKIIMMKIWNYDFPCKNCDKRSVNCHSSCKDYLKAKEAAEKEREHASKERLTKNYTNPYWNVVYGRRRK